MMKYQITLVCDAGQYRPVSTVIESTEVNLLDRTQKKQIADKGIIKICAKRRWRSGDLKRFGYNRVKVREYDPEQIAQEQADNYDLIKAMKYLSGEWQRPKGE